MVLVCSKTAFCNVIAVEILFLFSRHLLPCGRHLNTEVSRLLCLSAWSILRRKHVRKHWDYPITEPVHYQSGPITSVPNFHKSARYGIKTRIRKMRQKKENKLYSDLDYRCSGDLFLIAMTSVMILVPRLLNLLKYTQYIK